MSHYNLRKVRALLVEGFTAEELERFCRDTPDFNPVYNELHRRASPAEIANRILAHADGAALMPALLDWAKASKPVEYAKNQPYIVEPAEKNQPSTPEQKPNKPASPPTPYRMYDQRKIRRLFMEAFTAEELEQLCRDTPDFKPVYSDLPQRASNIEISEMLLEYSEQKWLVEVLLDWAKARNPAEYEKYQPYYQELDEK